MAVLSSRRRGQANDELRFDLPHDLFEAEGGQVMALVGDYLPVLGNTVLHFTFTLQALKQGYIDQSGPLVLAANDLTDGFRRKIQKHRKACAPLFE